MNRRPSSRRLRTGLAAAALAAIALEAPPPVAADDRDLLRFKVAKPYVFLMLDTSGSMNLKMGDGNVPLEGHADDPASRLYGAKEALFSVLNGVDDVQFGFAGLNHDRLKVSSLHWLYYVEQVPSGWPFQGSSNVDWPLPDADGLTTDHITVDTNGDGVADSGDGVPDNDIEGDALVFGTAFVDSSGVEIPGGTCSSPIDLGTTTGRRKVNAFAKTGTTGNSSTTLWFKVSGGSTGGTYRLAVERPGYRPDGSENVILGRENLAMKFKLTGPVSNCGSLPTTETVHNFALHLDDHLDRILMVDRGEEGTQGGNAKEWTAALWPFSDASSVADCGSSHPFTGKAWEGNYDSGVEPPGTPSGVDPIDTYCSGGSCVDLKPMKQTVLSTESRALDEGDMLPFRWDDGGDHRTEILQRLAPNWPEQNPDFSISHHLAEDPSAIGVFPARVAGRPPLIAVGDTPLEASLNDFRCWYMGDKGKNSSGKCGQSAYYDEGWSAAACASDPEYGCRRPYLLIISDGDNTCHGESPVADLSDMKSFTGVTTFALNLGDPRNCNSGGGLHSIVQATGGQCFNVANKEELRGYLVALIGQFREQAQTFATAAVPSVQATADQSIYISTFTPLNGKPVWDGRLNAFLKPLPVNNEGIPDLSIACGDGTEAGCHLWDAGAAMLSQHNPADRIGNGVNQRRVSYALEGSTGVPRPSRPLDPIVCTDDSGAGYEDCVDLLEGMEIPYDAGDIDVMEVAEDRANLAITTALTPRLHTLQNLDGTFGDTISYSLGDIFHSDPVVVGPARNFLYFGQDLQSDGTPCTHDETGNPGYRCFAVRHRYRRKVIYVGSDDGLLHAFEAGRFRESGTDLATGKEIENRYDNGTGHELFGFVPRAVLPTLRTFSESSSHHYTVDGSPVVADVFIDPVHGGTPSLAERRWRSVLIGSLREGGSQYFALDVTQPDKLKDAADGGEGYVPDDGGDTNWVPTCASAYNASQCGPVPYGGVLWEFDDRHVDSVLVASSLPVDPPLAMDEDGNHEPDLGDTWSRPTIGRIRLCAVNGTRCDPTPASPAGDDDLVTHEVAVFGGGMDPWVGDKSQPARADFLYMLDVETGKVLYKRRLCSPYVTGTCVTGGAAASDPAAVDTDQDGYLDRIYVGTTGGFLYRVDLGTLSDGRLPTLTSQATTAVDATQASVAVTVRRVQRTEAAGAKVWEPRVVFDANWSNDGTGGATATSARRQLYYPPSVFFAARLGVFGLAFGTGNRENLWSRSEQPGRFYLFLDDTDSLPATSLPLDEGDLDAVFAGDANQSLDVLFTRPAGQRGWFIGLDPDERIITESFVLSGLTTFSAFQPETALTENDGGNLEEATCGEKSFETDVDNLCARSGFSRTFLVATTSGDGLFTDISGADSRYVAVSTFVTTSFTEAGLVKSDASEYSVEGTSDQLTTGEIDLMNDLKTLFPSSCRFSNYRLDIKMVAADTRLQRIAPIPICLQDKNWKEF